jgi:N-acetylglutamate synthase-like GNAT family acetyltransferase
VRRTTHGVPSIRAMNITDRPWVLAMLRDRWGTPEVLLRGELVAPADLPGFVAADGADRVGLLTYRDRGNSVEIVTIDSLAPGRGVGSALVEAVSAEARRLERSHVCVVTTNDNLSALAWYRRRGFEVVEVRAGAVDAWRHLKPSIPLVNEVTGAAISDEVELVIELGPLSQRRARD